MTRTVKTHHIWQRSTVALGAMLMATAASAQVQNGNFATDLSHWEQQGHKRTRRIQVQVQHLFSALNQPGSLAAASAAHRPPGEWSNPRSSWGAR